MGTMCVPSKTLCPFSKVFHSERLEPRVLPWQHHGRCHSVSFVMDISGAKFEEHCSNIMVGEMVQNSQSLYSFTFNAVIVIHEYIYSYSTTNFTLKKIYLFTFNDVFLIHEFIYSHLRDIFIHIQRVICVHIHDRNIHSPFSAHRLLRIIRFQLPLYNF